MSGQIVRRLSPVRATRTHPFTASCDTTISRMSQDGVAIEVIAARLERTPEAIRNRIYNLRKAGVIPGYTPRRRVLEGALGAIRFDPPVTLKYDDKLVAETLAAGGMPRAVCTSVGTIWVGPEGRPWRWPAPLSDERMAQG